MVANAAENGAEGGEIPVGHGFEQQPPHVLHVSRQHLGDQPAAGVGDRHDDAAFVVRRR